MKTSPSWPSLSSTVLLLLLLLLRLFSLLFNSDYSILSKQKRNFERTSALTRDYFLPLRTANGAFVMEVIWIWVSLNARKKQPENEKQASNRFHIILAVSLSLWPSIMVQYLSHYLSLSSERASCSYRLSSTGNQIELTNLQFERKTNGMRQFLSFGFLIVEFVRNCERWECCRPLEMSKPSLKRPSCRVRLLLSLNSSPYMRTKTRCLFAVRSIRWKKKTIFRFVSLGFLFAQAEQIRCFAFA